MTEKLADLAGYSLGKRVLEYGERDIILYALSVGAGADETELLYEKSLRTLPCYAAALGLWAVEAAGALGAYDRNRSLHAAQQLTIHKPLPVSGPIESEAHVDAVWDKGKAALVEIVVSSEVFTAKYSIFLPGLGGWGGDRGPAGTKPVDSPKWEWTDSYETRTDQAALYRLTGDRHPIHIDSAVAQANGFDRPILHGLCTLGITARMLSAAAGAHPSELRFLEARLAAPVLPGDTITTCATASQGNTIIFESKLGATTVLGTGKARFGKDE